MAWKKLAPENAISISNVNYIFDKDEYNRFCFKFEQDFDVEHSFSATLVLMQYQAGNFSSARKIVFELENTDMGIKSAGRLFLRIFKCAESGDMPITIDGLSQELFLKENAGMPAAGANVILRGVKRLKTSISPHNSV